MPDRRVYRNPPVHQVILDLQFASAVAPTSLAELPNTVGEELVVSGPITRHSNETLAGPRGFSNPDFEQEFWGWEFSASEPDRIVTVSANQVTQHFVRSESWPNGSYVGWESIAMSFRHLLDSLSSVFQDFEIRRAGLRYINRIAVPANTMLDEWFSIVPHPMEGLAGLWDFRISRTWERADAYKGMSATVTLGKTDASGRFEASDHPQSTDELTGILLEIDVFNLWVREAPKYSDVAEWIERAHSLENNIFETCITSELAALFEPTETQ